MPYRPPKQKPTEKDRTYEERLQTALDEVNEMIAGGNLTPQGHKLYCQRRLRLQAHIKEVRRRR